MHPLFSGSPLSLPPPPSNTFSFLRYWKRLTVHVRTHYTPESSVLQHPLVHPSIHPSIHPASQPTIQTLVRVREEDAAEIPSLPISIATTKASLCARMHERTAITPALSHKLIIRPPRLLEYLSYSSQKFQTLNTPLFPVSCPRPSDALPLPAFHKRRISRAV